MAFMPNPFSPISSLATLARNSSCHLYISTPPFSSSVSASHSSDQGHGDTAFECPPEVGVGLRQICRSIAPEGAILKAAIYPVRLNELDLDVANRYCEDFVRKQTSERYIVVALGIPSIFNQHKSHVAEAKAYQAVSMGTSCGCRLAASSADR